MSRQIYNQGQAILSKMFRTGFTHCTGIHSGLIRIGFQKEVDKVLRKDNIVALPMSAARRLFEGANPPVQTIHSQWRARVEDFLLLCDLCEALVAEGVNLESNHAQQDRKTETSDVGGLQGKHKTPKGTPKQKGRVRVPHGGQS